MDLVLPPPAPAVPVPEGDPARLAGAARVLRDLAQRSGMAAHQLQSTAAGLGVQTWCGPLSTQYLQRNALAVRSCRLAAEAFGHASSALQAYADQLAQAQAVARRTAGLAAELDSARVSLAVCWEAARRSRGPEGRFSPLDHLAEEAAFRREAQVIDSGVGAVVAQVRAVERDLADAQRVLAARLGEVSSVADALTGHGPAPARTSRYGSRSEALRRGVEDEVVPAVQLVGGLTGLRGDMSDTYYGVGAGLVHSARHPVEFAENAAGWEDIAAGEWLHWTGSLIPGALVTLATGGGGAVMKATKGTTALQKAGKTVEDVDRMTDAEAAAVVMRGKRPRPGSTTADGPPVLGQDLTFRASAAAQIAALRKNFVGPITRTDVRTEPRFYGNVHDAANELGTERSLMWGASLQDLLRTTSTRDYQRDWALPEEWGGRNSVTVVRLPEGHRGPVWDGDTAGQWDYWGDYAGGGRQSLHHSVESDQAVWTGPLPWDRVRDPAGAAADAARGLAAGAAVRAPAAQERDRQTARAR